jgi:hypothetical protein
MHGTEHSKAVRTGERVTQRVLLRTVSRVGGEPCADALDRRNAPGAAGVWKSPVNGALESGRASGEPQTSGAIAASHGDPSIVSQALAQPTRRGAPKVPVSAQRPGNMRSGPGLVQRHHVCADGQRIHVSGGDDGLVESVCSGVGALEHPGQRVLYPGLGEGPGDGPTALDIEHGSRMPIHERGLSGSGRISWGRREHGRSWTMDRQPIHRAAMAQREAGGHLPAGLLERIGCAAGVVKVVCRIQSTAATSIAGRRDTWGALSLPRVVRSQTSAMAVEIRTEVVTASIPPVAPPRGSLRDGRRRFGSSLMNVNAERRKDKNKSQQTRKD